MGLIDRIRNVALQRRINKRIQENSLSQATPEVVVQAIVEETMNNKVLVENTKTLQRLGILETASTWNIEQTLEHNKTIGNLNTRVDKVEQYINNQPKVKQADVVLDTSDSTYKDVKNIQVHRATKSDLVLWPDTNEYYPVDELPFLTKFLTVNGGTITGSLEVNNNLTNNGALVATQSWVNEQLAGFTPELPEIPELPTDIPRLEEDNSFTGENTFENKVQLVELPNYIGAPKSWVSLEENNLVTKALVDIQLIDLEDTVDEENKLIREEVDRLEAKINQDSSELGNQLNLQNNKITTLQDRLTQWVQSTKFVHIEENTLIYNPSHSYSVGAITEYANSIYISLQDENLGHTPTSDGDEWWVQLGLLKDGIGLDRYVTQETFTETQQQNSEYFNIIGQNLRTQVERIEDIIAQHRRDIDNLKQEAVMKTSDQLQTVSASIHFQGDVKVANLSGTGMSILNTLGKETGAIFSNSNGIYLSATNKETNQKALYKLGYEINENNSLTTKKYVDDAINRVSGVDLTNVAKLNENNTFKAEQTFKADGNPTSFRINSFEWNGTKYSGLYANDSSGIRLKFEIGDGGVPEIKTQGNNDLVIKNLATPNENSQAATKEYVDTKVGSINLTNVAKLNANNTYASGARNIFNSLPEVYTEKTLPTKNTHFVTKKYVDNLMSNIAQTLGLNSRQIRAIFDDMETENEA